MLVDNLTIKDPNKIDFTKLVPWEREVLELSLEDYMAKESKSLNLNAISGGMASLNNAKVQQ